ncbi:MULTISPECIES: EF-hand domain-containing protein [unclassified Moorena]|uniref:EF-hand domain-containing protein n=1 Tax=unclassified Moorena TaxID=2683338 RepID=UPI0013CA4F22|nr:MULTISPECIES: EF-hand domain-containing protein [unclassified Moorena]NEO18397.1 EF-hand domain-containing protein [Moorena sp. SIO4A5]NEP20962.1 EF-hand domain-containing protein [Moorena sp. SIO3I6]NEQ57435.1 EF-hand domain-containing protein [Moorena sp. SIO4A1]
MEEIPIHHFLDDIFTGVNVTEKPREMICNLLDVDGNGYVSWQEFVFRLKWAIQQKGLLYYPTPEALILGTFEFILQDFS